MRKGLLLFCLFLSLFLGINVAHRMKKEICFASQVYPASEFPLKERKSFVFVVYGYNQADWVQRSLRSILEQEYDAYRVVFIDDFSQDATFTKVKNYIEENHQTEKVLLLQNREKMGYIACLYQVVHGLLDQEIVIPMNAQDWLTHPKILEQINQIYQDPDVWMSSSKAISFPSYNTIPNGLNSFYAAIFKQFSFQTLIQESSYLNALQKIAQTKDKKLQDIFIISNQAAIYEK